MNFNQLINQVLDTAKQYSAKPENEILGKLGGGAAAAGLIAMLTKQGSGTRKLAQAGSMAALGALAYAAYQNWQQTQNGQTQPAADTPLLTQTAFTPEGTAAETAGRVLLRAMIAAAAADGEIDAAEQAAILQEGGGDEETRQWLVQETARPALPADIAREVGGDTALAAQTYLAARLVCADLSRRETAFLVRLAEALNLDDQLVENLERQAGL